MINDRMDRVKLVDQLRDMRAHDARSVCFHPLPPEFRPDTMGARLAPPYLSEEYFGIVREVVAECEDLGMSYWLYDEGGWPSGGAAGRVHALDPEAFACKALVFEDKELPEGERFEVTADVVCAALRVRDEWQVYLPGQVIESQEKPAVMREVSVERRAMVHGTGARQAQYVDILHPGATPAFLEVTHEQYRKHLGERFGSAIRCVFTDEPAASYTAPGTRLTWTDDLAEVFKRRK